jgi:signal transduction histidine kinase/CheY-like chemotaxis protein
MVALRWFPRSLARRFAIAAAGLAAAALVTTTLVSWWLIQQQHDDALRELSARERQYRATAVGSDLSELATRMSEIASSTILATGLVDSAGRETYLGPYLAGIRQINGIPIQVMLTDFQGTEIASNSGARFTPEQREWLRHQIDSGRPSSQIFPNATGGGELVAVEPMIYPRTRSPEGAVLYKIQLRDIKLGPTVKLQWGPAPQPLNGTMPQSVRVPSPPVFEPLQFRLQGEERAPAAYARADIPYQHVTLISLGLFAAIAAAGYVLARLLTRDLHALNTFSSTLFASGLQAKRAPEDGSEEVARLAHSINDMLDRLHQQHSTLLQEREKLTELTDALQAADRNKDNFLAMLGHELRNPLAPISAGAELLRRMPDADPRVMRTSDLIARQVRHMTKIVNDLLDVSRVTRGLITLDKVEVDVSDIVTAGVEQVRPLIESRRHTLAVSVPPERGVMLADRARMVQVVSNLLTNAAKYTPEGGHIVISVDLLDDQIEIEVHDNGVGISPELMPQIFELFTQGARAVDRHQGGLGLGLALVKNLVALHGGTVDARSDGEGQGTSFCVRMPRVVPTAAVSPDGLPAPARRAARSLQIMVVDDNVDAALALCQLLTLDGHRVAVAHDGPSALAEVEQVRADVYILDIGLPGMDGTELARRLRTMPEASGAMLIALTGYGQVADRERSAAARFDHHLVKPADSDLLRGLLAARVPRRRESDFAL